MFALFICRGLLSAPRGGSGHHTMGRKPQGLRCRSHLRVRGCKSPRAGPPSWPRGSCSPSSEVDRTPLHWTPALSQRQRRMEGTASPSARLLSPLCQRALGAVAALPPSPALTFTGDLWLPPCCNETPCFLWCPSPAPAFPGCPSSSLGCTGPLDLYGAATNGLTQFYSLH